MTYQDIRHSRMMARCALADAGYQWDWGRVRLDMPATHVGPADAWGEKWIKRHHPYNIRVLPARNMWTHMRHPESAAVRDFWHTMLVYQWRICA